MNHKLSIINYQLSIINCQLYKLIVLVFFSVTIVSFAQFKQDTKKSLFSDVKAFEVGDAITVLITEETQADNSATTNSSRSTDISGGVSASSGNKSFDGKAGLNTGNQFKGSGETSRKESIRSKLSARVLSVEQNGNLRIKGTRLTTINGEKQTIVIEGVVRPVDIAPNNSVFSYSILDLILSIEGNGEVTKVQEPGLITKFLRILF
jgi:flagellar L-ring protein FlgH